MRDAFLVPHPTGSGKTRMVLESILHGAGKSKATWRRRLSGVLVVGPNDRFAGIWERELFILAIDRGLIRDVDESQVRHMPTRERRALIRDELLDEEDLDFTTYQRLLWRRGGPCRYLVLDEWHRIAGELRHACEKHVVSGGSRRWCLGGRGATESVYFVSATPLNPVLEGRDELQREYEDWEFEDMMNQAAGRALRILQAFTGRRPRKKWREADKCDFVRRVRELGIKIPRPHKLQDWQLPRTVAARDRFPDVAETRVLKRWLAEPEPGGWAKEYAEVVGLVRTHRDRARREQVVCTSHGGRRRCFSVPYQELHVPEEILSGKLAWKYVADHPRFRRLVRVLERQAVLRANGPRLGIGLRKALVFCTHQGVARGLVRTLNKMVVGVGSWVRPAETNVWNDDLDATIDRFNTKGEYPSILIATDALSEGYDLHEACNFLVHYELPWSPLRLMQRVGRVARLKGKQGYSTSWTAHVIVPGSVEEERVNRLVRRCGLLHREKLWPSAEGLADSVAALVGGGPSMHLEEALAALES